MRRVLRQSGSVLVLLVAAAGCTSMSGSVSTPRLSPTALQATPEAYEGQKVTLGGTIVAVHPRPDGADIEVMGRPLDREGRPEPGDRTTGRFVVRAAAPLDADAYAPGRAITAVGPVAPMASWWVADDGAYRYPVLSYPQILLWPPNTTTGGVYVGQRYWVWPYTFWWGPAPYVPLVTIW